MARSQAIKGRYDRWLQDLPPETLSTLIMFAASPGTIAIVIALSVVHNAAKYLRI
jgi:hypothetical protein